MDANKGWEKDGERVFGNFLYNLNKMISVVSNNNFINFKQKWMLKRIGKRAFRDFFYELNKIIYFISNKIIS